MTNDSPASLAKEFGTTAADVRSILRLLYGPLPDGTSRWVLTADQANEVRSYVYGLRASGPPSTVATGVAFERLRIDSWRQFEHVDIDLSARLTILTGENGTGKTSLLALLGRAIDYESSRFVGTPARDKTGFFFRQGRRRPQGNGEFDGFGTISFSSGASSEVGVYQYNVDDDPEFTPELVPHQEIEGLYLDAQRVIGPYQRVESIPPRFNSASEIARLYREQLRNVWNRHSEIKSPSLLIKEALIAAALYGEGNTVVARDDRAAEVWNGFQNVLMTLFPKSLGFAGLRVDQGEIILDSASGPFALEASSGGLAALFSLAWQIYLHSVDAPTFTVCFDEPENHLHPSLQRSILPALLDAFPRVRFVVATHSPFVVTSMPTASVYALRRRDGGGVFTEKLDLQQQALTADEALDEVLGVGTTLPIWAERRLDEALKDFREGPKDADSLRRLSLDLQKAGLRITTPEVTTAVADSVVMDEPDAQA